MSDKNKIGRLFTSKWWRHAWKFSVAFIPTLRTPIILCTIAGLMLLLARDGSIPLQKDGAIDGNLLLPILLRVMVGSTIAGILYLIAIGQLVIRLAGLTRAYLLLPLDALDTPGYDAKINATLAEGLSAVRSHKGQLAKAWLVCSVISIPLLFVFNACILASFGLTDKAIEFYQLPPETVQLRTWAIAGLIISGLLLSNYSVTALAVTAMLNRSIKEASIESLWLSFTALPALTLVSIFVLAASAIITTPFAVAGIFKPGLNVSLPLALALEIWQNVSNLMVIPISVAMLCEVVRDSVVNLKSE